MTFAVFALLSCSVILVSCKGDDDDDIEEEVPAGDNDMSVFKSSFYGDGVTWSQDDDWITISTDNQPDHKSMYYGTGHDLYEAYDEPTNQDFNKNPNSIEAQNYTLKIPRYPEMASSHEATAMDAFGVAVNGVVFFNQEAAPGDDILEELNTFDQYEGHPQNQGAYHYHIEPIWLTETIGDDAFMGFLWTC